MGSRLPPAFAGEPGNDFHKKLINTFKSTTNQGIRCLAPLHHAAEPRDEPDGVELVAWLRRAMPCLAALPQPTHVRRQSHVTSPTGSRDETEDGLWLDV